MVNICCYNQGKARCEGMHFVLLVSHFQLYRKFDISRSICLTVTLNYSAVLSLSYWLIQSEHIDFLSVFNLLNFSELLSQKFSHLSTLWLEHWCLVLFFLCHFHFNIDFIVHYLSISFKWCSVHFIMFCKSCMLFSMSYIYFSLSSIYFSKHLQLSIAILILMCIYFSKCNILFCIAFIWHVYSSKWILTQQLSETSSSVTNNFFHNIFICHRAWRLTFSVLVMISLKRI